MGLEDEVIFEDLDIWEATSEALKFILIRDLEKKPHKYHILKLPSISTVRKFLYMNGRSETKGLTKAWESLTGLMRVGNWRG